MTCLIQYSVVHQLCGCFTHTRCPKSYSSCLHSCSGGGDMSMPRTQSLYLQNPLVSLVCYFLSSYQIHLNALFGTMYSVTTWTFRTIHLSVPLRYSLLYNYCTRQLGLMIWPSFIVIFKKKKKNRQMFLYTLAWITRNTDHVFTVVLQMYFHCKGLLFLFFLHLLVLQLHL